MTPPPPGVALEVYDDGATALCVELEPEGIRIATWCYCADGWIRLELESLRLSNDEVRRLLAVCTAAPDADRREWGGRELAGIVRELFDIARELCGRDPRILGYGAFANKQQDRLVAIAKRLGWT